MSIKPKKRDRAASPKITRKPNRWEYLGEVGVDSGQLLVTDPCYLASEWQPKDDDVPSVPIPVFEEVATRRRFACELHGPLPDGTVGFLHFEQPIPACDNLTPNTLISSGRWMKLPSAPPSGTFSYRGCCEATCGDRSSGQLKYRKGHAGAGVVFSSGYGDGVYAVLGRRNKEGRITEVRIQMG